jgi:hypothetical protein
MPIPKSLCISCFTVLYDDNPPVQPKEGDTCVCVYCGHIMQFDKDLKVRNATNPTKLAMQASALTKLTNAILGKNSPSNQLNIIVESIKNTKK